MAWFGNGLGVGIDPGLLPAKKPALRDEFESSKNQLDQAHALKKAEEWARTHESDGEYFRRTGQQRGATEYHDRIAREKALDLRKRIESAQLDAERVGESDGEYFRRTGQQRGAEAYRAEIRRQKAAKEYRDRMDATKARQKRAANFDWSTATDEFEASKTALDRQHEAKKESRDRAIEFTRTQESDGEHFRRTGQAQEGRRVRPIPPSDSPQRKPASYYAPNVKPRPTLIFKPTPKPKPMTPIVPIDPGLKPLPATQVSLLEAQQHLNVVPVAENRPVPSYLDPHAHVNEHTYDNPVRDRNYVRRVSPRLKRDFPYVTSDLDAPIWRLQDRAVALLPFNKPNTPDWDDPGKAVSATAKLRKAIDDTNYTEKRAKYVHAKSDKADAAAKVKQIQANLDALKDVTALSGLGNTDPNMEDMVSYWEGQLKTAKSDLTTKTAAYNTARNEEMAAGRKVKSARNDMDKYLRRGPYSRDTKVTIGSLLGAAVGGLVVYNIIMPLPSKRKTRKYNPLYSVFA